MSTPSKPRREPSARAQATRSLRLAEQLRATGRPEAYRQALTAHFTEFSSSVRAGRGCPLRQSKL